MAGFDSNHAAVIWPPVAGRHGEGHKATETGCSSGLPVIPHPRGRRDPARQRAYSRAHYLGARLGASWYLSRSRLFAMNCIWPRCRLKCDTAMIRA